MTDHEIVSAEDWLLARKNLLAEEKAMSRAREVLAEKRRALPWTLVEKAYEFQGPEGTCSLGDLFGGNSQLIVQHFMFGSDWEEGCPSCSLMADSFGQIQGHMNARDVSLVAISRAPLAKLQSYRERMGWHFPWVSSSDSEFNFDFNVSFSEDAHEKGDAIYNYRQSTFPSEEAPGISVFVREDDGTIFHTYSSFARGLDDFISTYRFLDVAPKGRDEQALAYPMAWVKRHDQY